MKKEQLKQLIREAIIAERNSSIGVVKNIIKNEFGIDTEIDKTEKLPTDIDGRTPTTMVMKF